MFFVSSFFRRPAISFFFRFVSFFFSVSFLFISEVAPRNPGHATHFTKGNENPLGNKLGGGPSGGAHEPPPASTPSVRPSRAGTPPKPQPSGRKHTRTLTPLLKTPKNLLGNVAIKLFDVRVFFFGIGLRLIRAPKAMRILLGRSPRRSRYRPSSRPPPWHLARLLATKETQSGGVPGACYPPYPARGPPEKKFLSYVHGLRKSGVDKCTV